MKNKKSAEQATVAVLYGGPSAERAVSAVSAEAMCGALKKLSIPFTKIDMQPGWMEALKASGATFVLLALHGSPGEDGTVQGALDLLGYPYNGSGVLASALAMDKPRAKMIFAAAGLDVAVEEVFEPADAPAKVNGLKKLKLPVVVKPTSQGSTVGTSVVHSPNEWSGAVKAAQGYGTMMVEEYIPGRELTVAVLGDRALTVTEIVSANSEGFYDYQAKYTTGGSRHILPADLPKDIFNRAMTWAVTAHKALGCTGISRSDFRYDEATGRLVILEINTLPGMTPTSLVPEQAAHCGMDFPALVKWMIEEAQCRFKQAA